MEEKEIRLTYLSEVLGDAFKGFGGPEENPTYILCWEYSLTAEHRKILKGFGAKSVRKLKTTTLRFHFPADIKLVNDLPNNEG